MAMSLTQVYLEPAQKKELAARAKVLGRKPSELIREAVDTYLAGLTAEELALLDAATKQTARDLEEIAKTLDAGQRRARTFFREIEKIRAKGDRL